MYKFFSEKAPFLHIAFSSFFFFFLAFPLLITSVSVEQNDCNDIFQFHFSIFAVGLVSKV